MSKSFRVLRYVTCETEPYTTPRYVISHVEHDSQLQSTLLSCARIILTLRYPTWNNPTIVIKNNEIWSLACRGECTSALELWIWCGVRTSCWKCKRAETNLGFDRCCTEPERRDVEKVEWICGIRSCPQFGPLNPSRQLWFCHRKRDFFFARFAFSIVM